LCNSCLHLRTCECIDGCMCCTQGEFNGLKNELARAYPDRACLYFEFNEPLSHIVYAAADILVVPSMFEPCGLTQMIGMRCEGTTLVCDSSIHYYNIMHRLQTVSFYARYMTLFKNIGFSSINGSRWESFTILFRTQPTIVASLDISKTC
jgi:hypothetical protein